MILQKLIVQFHGDRAAVAMVTSSRKVRFLFASETYNLKRLY